MRVAIIQPNYIPWRGYFDFINSVDTFVFYDDVQYTPRDWRNRNRIKTKDGAVWLSVPVRNPHRCLIRDVAIDDTTDWRSRHLKTIQGAYSSAKFFKPCFDEFAEVLMEREISLSSLDMRLARWVMEKLSIHTPTLCSSELQPQGAKTERLLDVLKKLRADSYLSGPAAAAYLDTDLLRQNGIQVAYKVYEYAPYPQLHGAFAPHVSILDLLFNTGPEARQFLRSQLPDTLL